MMVARSRGVAVVRRASRSASGMSAPRRVSTRTALSSIDQTCRSSSRSARTSAIRVRWAGPSATTARAPESRRMCPTWSADDVSYTGTDTAPANQMA